uniref:IRG-type G domain-containing protein n=1 Tax=Neogobius melanostomus TaxID=47308 RepID=A0A8C6TXJ6_9GOBI
MVGTATVSNSSPLSMSLPVSETALQNSDLSLAAQKALEYLDRLKNVPLNIAITGESGSGKSTLVNGAAPTGAVETTMEPTEYIHPQYPNVKIWDLPGVGTTKFTADKYLEHVGFEKYDFFIIVSCDRFRENDAKLAKEIQKMKKKFYFVRSKIDNSIRDEKDGDPELNEVNLLELIRDNCSKELQKLGFESPKVFLVSSLKLHLYEFEDLWKTLDKELPTHQRNVMLLALPNISADVIEQKKQALEDRIKWYTLASAAGAVVPVTGFSDAFDMALLLEFATECKRSLGLMPESLQNLSNVSSIPLEDLKAEIKSSLGTDQLNTTVMIKVLSKAANYITSAAAELEASPISVFGIVLAMTSSSVTTYTALKYILTSLTQDAQQIFMKALKLCTSV